MENKNLRVYKGKLRERSILISFQKKNLISSKTLTRLKPQVKTIKTAIKLII